MSENTALARTEDELPEGGKQEIRAIQQAGALAVERQKAINTTTRQLAGMTWGSGYQAVKGEDLSGATRYAIAQLCELTGANPALHLYILGGRPYLNADYWRERTAGQPHFVRSEQRNLSLRHIEELRALADQAAADGDDEEAVKLRREARELARARSHYSPPEWASEVVETIIYRYRETAPLGAIRTGQIDGEPWIEEVRECNWAGNRPPNKKKDGGSYDSDPVGNAEPAKTARSRSYRRCAIGAFSTTLSPIEHELRKLEEAIEAEFEVIAEDRREERASLPTATGPQAVRIGAGEPEAAVPVEAEPLPVEEHGETVVRSRVGPAGNGRAERKKFEEGCRAMGIEKPSVWAKAQIGCEPETLEDYQRANAALVAFADTGAEPADQEGLGL